VLAYVFAERATWALAQHIATRRVRALAGSSPR
jgi:hypothetical protein